MLLRFVGESLWFFLPAFVGNQFPGFAVWIMARCNRSHWNVPVSERWLGKNKTWPAYPAAILGAMLTLWFQVKVGGACPLDCDRLWLLGGIVRLRSQVADRRTRLQIPPTHLQPGNIGADLNASKIFKCARIASDIAGERPARAYVSGCCGCAGAEVAADAAGPHAATCWSG